MISTLKWHPREITGNFHCAYNNLSYLIVTNVDIICAEGEDFSIWRRDGTLDERRFKYMMEILKEEGKI